MEMENLKSVVEALIFASESALTLNSLCNILEGIERKEIRTAIETLKAEYIERDGGFFIEEVGGGYRLRTKSEHAPWIKRLFKIGPPRISKAAMESLSIIAYRQPITRAELEAIRGVDAGGVLAKLLDKRLIKITGRKETPGRPVVYGTTKEFLETFDLKDLSCLPSLKELKSLEEEYDRDEEQDEELKDETKIVDQESGQTNGQENVKEYERYEGEHSGEEAGEGLVCTDTNLEEDPSPGSEEENNDTGSEDGRGEGDEFKGHDPDSGKEESSESGEERKEEEPA